MSSVDVPPAGRGPSSWDLVRAFLVLSTELQVGVAASRLGVSSRTLSRHMAQLEGELGVTLMVRSTRRVVLTRAGETLRSYALSMEHTMGQATKAVGGGRPGPYLSVGTSTDLPTRWLHQLETWVIAHDAPVVIERRQIEDGLAMLRVGSLDLLLIVGDADPGPEAMVVGAEPLLAVFPASHPAARQKAILVGDLRDLPVAVSDVGSIVHHREFVQALHGDPDLPHVVAPRAGTIAPGLIGAARRQRAASLVLASETARVDTTGLAVLPMEPPLSAPVVLISRTGLPRDLLVELAVYLRDASPVLGD